MTGAMPPRAWKPLPIWCADGEVDSEALARIKAAKEALWLDYIVKPQGAGPSMDTRVLAWGTHPPFIAPYALVDPLGTDDELMEALAWVLGEVDECRVAMTYEMTLSAVLGLTVREVTPEELEAEERLADYQEGR